MTKRRKIIAGALATAAVVAGLAVAGVGGSAGFDWQAAYTNAQPGAVIDVPTGSYAVTLTGTKANAPCDGYSIDGNTSGCVTFQPAPSATVSFSQNLTVTASSVRLKGFRAGVVIGDCNQPLTRGVVLDHMTGGFLGIQNASFVGDLAGNWGPSHGNQIAYLFGCPASTPNKEPDHVRFDGSNFHDAIQDAAGQHLECLHTEPAEYVTVRNSRFANCAQHDISFGGGGPGRGFLVEQNTLANPCSGQASPPCQGNNPIDASCNGGDHSGWIVRFNSIAGAMVNNLNTGCTYTNGQFYGNVTDAGWWSSWQCQNFDSYGFTSSYNVNNGPACGQGSVSGIVMKSPSVPDYDFTPLARNPGIGLVPASLARPATDVAGAPRGTGSTDAGAYVYTTTAPPPPVPPPPPPPVAPPPPPPPPPVPTGPSGPTGVPPAYNPACKPTCDAQITALNKRIAAAKKALG